MRYATAHYAEALHKTVKDKTAPQQKEIIGRFMAMVARHRMGGKIALIIAAYEKLALAESGTRKVYIVSAAPVRAQLKREIREILGKKIRIEETVDPALLAGIKIIIDNELLIDASVKRQLEKIFPWSGRKK
jgi:F0F1-type ATP synthase delta subunit